MDKLKALWKEWNVTIIVFALSVLIPFVISRFVQTPQVDGDSMLPTYNDNDRVVILCTNNVEVNDIAVIWCESLDEYIVKRVIGVQGDTIEMKSDGLYRNGIKLYESYINEQDWLRETVPFEIVVPDGNIFVLGDNRNHSLDSRALGTFALSNVKGVVIADEMPF